MEFIDFVLENYIWFIVGFIVIVMTIIGYYAEQTEFGKKVLEKDIKPKKENKKEKKDIVEEIMEEKENSIAPIENQEEDLNVPLETPVETKEELPMEDLNVPFGDTKKEDVLEEPIQVMFEKPESIQKTEQPIEMESEIEETTEEPVNEVNEIEQSFEMPEAVSSAPKVETNMEEQKQPETPKTEESIDEDDVWNF